jgi:hypothetical protein
MSRLWVVGEMFTIDKCYAWSKRFECPTNKLRQFVITQGGKRNEILWYPYLIDSGPYRIVVNIPDKIRLRRWKPKYAQPSDK